MTKVSIPKLAENIVDTYDEFDAFRVRDNTLELLYPRGTEVKDSTAKSIARVESRKTDLEIREVSENSDGISVDFN